MWTRRPEPVGDPDPTTPAVPIVFPLSSPVIEPPVDCDDEKTLISCNEPLTLLVIVLFLKLKSRFDDASCVKLAPMPLFVNVLDWIVKSVMVPVSCVCTSRPRSPWLF